MSSAASTNGWTHTSSPPTPSGTRPIATKRGSGPPGPPFVPRHRGLPPGPDRLLRRSASPPHHPAGGGGLGRPPGPPDPPPGAPRRRGDLPVEPGRLPQGLARRDKGGWREGQDLSRSSWHGRHAPCRGRLHALQRPVHAESQQTPSTQEPLVHALFCAHAAPCAASATHTPPEHVPLWQSLPTAQCLLVPQR